jgi:hypothetical protein
MNTYHFTVTLRGSGDTPEEAWEDAVEAFTQDPGEPHETKLEESDDTWQNYLDFLRQTAEARKEMAQEADDYNPEAEIHDMYNNDEE